MFMNAVGKRDLLRSAAIAESKTAGERDQARADVAETNRKLQNFFDRGDFSAAAAAQQDVNAQERILNAKDIELGSFNELYKLLSNPQVMVAARRMGLLDTLSAQLGVNLEFPPETDESVVLKMMKALGPLSSSELIPRLSEIATLTGWSLDDLVEMVQKRSPFGSLPEGGSRGGTTTYTRGGR